MEKLLGPKGFQMERKNDNFIFELKIYKTEKKTEMTQTEIKKPEDDQDKKSIKSVVGVSLALHIFEVTFVIYYL